MQEPLRVLVEGQGALGTFFGAVLGHAGHQVHVRSSRAGEPEDVRLTAVARRPVTATVTLADERPPRPVDVAIVTSRAADALEHARAAEPCVRPGGVVVPLQNGLVPLDVLDTLGAKRVAPLVVGFNAGLVDETTVELTSPGGVVVGALDREPARLAKHLALALHQVVPARTTDNPRGAVWSKWCVSCAINGLAIATGTGVGPLTAERDGRLALLGVVTECVELAQAEGVRFERVAGPLTPDRLAGPAERGLGAAVRHGLVRLLGRRYRGVEPSALEALRGGRDVELHTLNERAVSLGNEHGVATPWNAGVAALAGAVVWGDRDPSLNALEELARAARA